MHFRKRKWDKELLKNIRRWVLNLTSINPRGVRNCTIGTGAAFVERKPNWIRRILCNHPYGIRNINLSASTVVYTVYQSPYAQPTLVGSCTFASESGIRNLLNKELVKLWKSSTHIDLYQSPYGIRNTIFRTIKTKNKGYQSPYAQPTYVGSCTFASESGIRNNKILCSFLLYTIVLVLSRANIFQKTLYFMCESKCLVPFWKDSPYDFITSSIQINGEFVFIYI